MNELNRVDRGAVRTRRPISRSIGFASVVVALALVPLALAFQGAGTPASNSDPRQVINKGIDLLMTVTVAKPGLPAAAVSVADVRTLKHGLSERLSKYFTGDALKREIELLSRALEGHIESGRRNTNGGARSVEILELAIDGPTAAATARVQLSLRTEGVDAADEIVDTTGWWLYSVHLVEVDGKWLIDDYSAEPMIDP